MQYLKVRWIHDFANEPVLLYSEMNDEREEVRKVDVFADGRMGFASESQAHGDTELSEPPMPPDDVIRGDPQFVVEDVTADEFDRVWREATAAVS
jgi:hypothetical protein